jgi:uncharacterized protein YaiI (UPF0178 family)
MTIWLDADASPKPVKDILFRAAHSRHIPLILVANQYISVPSSPFIKSLVVTQGFDEADNYIIENCHLGDLVITQDIPLASEVLQKGAEVITPRGQTFTEDSIKARLTMRDFMETMRSSGLALKDGPPPYSQQDKQTFANLLDSYIQRLASKTS